jgi:adenylosuccinate synthase
VDLGFGDAGKGVVTDFLTRHLSAAGVVRFNGGGQAGHNVTTADGRHHTYSQFGAGSFVPGVWTYFAAPCVLHPGALAVEARVLESRGVHDALSRFFVDERCLVTTPFHQALGRLRELSRGARAHGTCGVGFGETVADALRSPDAVLRARDLADPARVRRLARRIQERLRLEARGLPLLDAARAAATREAQLLDDPQVADAWLEHLEPLTVRLNYADEYTRRRLLGTAASVLFEGAQGVLLDEDYGFHPHTTWSRCTFEAAQGVLDECATDRAIYRLGVLRTYATRHGPGPFPSEVPDLSAVLPEPHNAAAGWQGAFRVGWLDAVLLRYAARVSGGLDGLAVTHLDRVQRTEGWCAVEEYRDDAGSAVRSITPPAPNDWVERRRLTEALFRVHPRPAPVGPGASSVAHKQRALLEWIEQTTGATLALSFSGPTADAGRWR